MSRPAMLAAAWLVCVACASSAPSPPASTTPVSAPGAELSAAHGRALLEAGIDARALAYAAGDGSGLAATFAGRPLAGDRVRLEEMRRRGQRREEQVDERRLVHWAAAERSAEGVLLVRARVRLLAGPAGPAPWSSTVRQWWARLAPGPGGWRIVEDHDLPPNQWWREPA